MEAVLALAPENLLASRALVDICEREAAAALTDVPAARAAEAVLAEKTQGNLTPEESLFLTQVLSALRARYLEARQGGDGVAAATPGAPGRS